MNRCVIKARVRLLTTSEGGRESAISNTYRSVVRFGATTGDFGYELKLEDERLEPGESGIAELSFWAVSELPTLTPGQQFEMREGPKLIGEGSILEVLS